MLHTEAARLGVPAHMALITVLSPSTLPECIDGAIVARIGEARCAPRCPAVEPYENATGRWRPMQRFELAR